MKDPRPYAYSPLVVDSIRLLGLGATDCSAGTLKTVHLSKAPPYFALSYTWDAQTRDVPIQVDDQTLSVGPSLAEAIRRLQELIVDDSASDPQVKWVWIDQICINQDDVSERSKQVQLMNSIYSQAIRTLIWLGPHCDSCPAVWQLIDQIYDVFQRENPYAESVADIPFRFYSDRYHAASGLPDWDHELWQHLRRLLELPWFTRTWIVQEVALSRRDPILLLGQHRYPWHHLGWASSWLRRNGYLRVAQVPNRIQNIDTISNIRRYRTRWRLDALLVITSIKCHATDQRDKVYGLLGLAAENQDLSHMLCPNYELDVVEVYTKITLFFLREYQSLSILTRANGVSSDVSWTQRKHQSDLLPTWVPNWCDYSVVEREVAKSLSWLSHPTTVDAAILGFPEHYNASTRLPVKLFESSSLSVLRLSGLNADAVVSATKFDDKLQSPLLQLWMAALPLLPVGGALADWIASWIKATTAEQHILSGSTAEQSVKDGSAYLHNILSSNEYQQIYRAGDQEIIRHLSKMSIGGDPETYAVLATNFCFNRRFIVTLKGRMGIGPNGTQPGDLIFVIFGGGVPYILRMQESGYLFVGESYIHGLMDGEAVQAWQRGEQAEEILELR
ncbi:HET domain-containing protein [Rhexocercosporidium sp. MPI-PUGE-AT-0058]|nr:HET domain-containing protein [Rhexocercosporidium sp. MPI-PUGE-AT-0058]